MPTQLPAVAYSKPADPLLCAVLCFCVCACACVCAAAGVELTVSDLIAGLGDSRGKLGAARKVLEKLEKKAAPVAAPLPGPLRHRQERKAG